MKVNSENLMNKHKRPQSYLKWNITKLPKSPTSSPKKSVEKDLIYQSCQLRKRSLTKSPIPHFNSKVEIHKKPKLFSSIHFKQVFVLQDGSSVSPNSKFQGFNYPIQYTTSLSRISHSEEMKDFFQYCKEYFNSQQNFNFLFSYKGKLLKCLHEVPPDSKIVIVSPSEHFQGISEAPIKVNRSLTRSPIYIPSSIHHCVPQITEKINSQFEILIKKHSRPEDSPVPQKKPTKTALKRFEKISKKCNLEGLKNKLPEEIAKIEKTYPAIHIQGLEKLRSRYEFPEGKLHSLSAKFKTLVLLSSAIDPTHNLNFGVNRTSFIDSNATSKEQSFLLGRIFDVFDTDKDGKISWEEFMSAMKILDHGSYNEMIDLFFKVYDRSGKGYLGFADIKELCKVQLQSSNSLVDELAESFASLIFDITKTSYEGKISALTVKEIVANNKDQSLIDMFCSFQFLKF